HPVRGRNELSDYYLFPGTIESHAPFLSVRVRAAVDSICDPGQYEAFTCFLGPSREVARDAKGRVSWEWKVDTPLTQEEEAGLIRAGKLREEEARYQVRD